ncbi:hypothetical protein PoB_005080000 [Plakobranchus ocellatus]|uniref:Uncharacterized protein n=1 Tax=Plakobranchus ocellatus TaxID=259542 RepID=A0AAV4BV30_9GAST|nr:hypothetical protein PoB_005080000 [Plakobranchus ocellatus]
MGRLYTTNPQQGDFKLSGPRSGQDAGGGVRTRDRSVPADLPTSPVVYKKSYGRSHTVDPRQAGLKPARGKALADERLNSLALCTT